MPVILELDPKLRTVKVNQSRVTVPLNAYHGTSYGRIFKYLYRPICSNVSTPPWGYLPEYLQDSIQQSFSLYRSKIYGMRTVRKSREKLSFNS